MPFLRSEHWRTLDLHYFMAPYFILKRALSLSSSCLIALCLFNRIKCFESAFNHKFCPYKIIWCYLACGEEREALNPCIKRFNWDENTREITHERAHGSVGRVSGSGLCREERHRFEPRPTLFLSINTIYLVTVWFKALLFAQRQRTEKGVTG